MRIILFVIASLLSCAVIAQVQPYEIEYAPAEKYILLSKLSPSGEYDHALLSTIGLSEFDDDISLWESTGTYSVSVIGAPLENILLGTDAGNSITTGNYNFITGTNLPNTASTSYNTGIGYRNLYTSFSANYATGIGRENLFSATSADYATGIGRENMYSATNASYATGIGYANMRSATSAVSATGIGLQNMYTATTANYATGIGDQNMYTATDASYATGIGRDNMYSASSAFYATGIGYQNMYNATSADYATGIGYANMYNATAAIGATGIGRQNMYLATSADYAISMGFYNLYDATSANYSISLGYQNAFNSAASQNNSIYLGYRQAYTTGADYRLHIGMYQDNPLIYGEFDNEEVEIGGKLGYTTEGGSAVSLIGKDASDKLTTADVGDLVKANGLWTESGADIYRSTGNVGIGSASSPDAKLTVSSSNSGAANNNTLRFVDTDVTTQVNQSFGKIEFETKDPNNPGVNAFINAFAEGTGATGVLSFGTGAGGSTERMRINSSGNVGIGTTSPFASSNNEGLHIDRGGHSSLMIGDGVNDGGILQSSDNRRRLFLGVNVYDDPSNSWRRWDSGDGSAAIDIHADDLSGDYIRFLVDNSGSGFPTERVRITNNGNVGIGTNSPSQKLDVVGNIKLSETAATTDTDKFAVLDAGVIKYRTGTELLSDIGGQAAIVNPVTGTGSTNYLSKWTSTSAQGNSQLFDNGTNIGLGTSSPSAKLDVVGDAEINGELFVTDAISSGGTVDAQLFLTSNNQVVERSIKYESGYRRTAVKVIGTTSTDIDGWTEMYDVDNKYSISTASITIPTNGTYKISFNADITGTTQTKEYEVQLWNATDGVQVRLNEFTLLIDSTDGVDNGHCHAQFIETLTASKTYKIRMKERTGNSGSLLLVDTSMSIELKAEAI